MWRSRELLAYFETRPNAKSFSLLLKLVVSIVRQHDAADEFLKSLLLHDSPPEEEFGYGDLDE